MTKIAPILSQMQSVGRFFWLYQENFKDDIKFTTSVSGTMHRFLSKFFKGQLKKLFFLNLPTRSS